MGNILKKKLIELFYSSEKSSKENIHEFIQFSKLIENQPPKLINFKSFTQYSNSILKPTKKIPLNLTKRGLNNSILPENRIKIANMI